MIDENNPAGRFYALLNQAKNQGANQKVRNVWAKTLGADEKNDSEVISKVIALYQLGEEVKNLVSMVDGVNKQLYLSSFPQIERAIFPLNLDAGWQGYQRHLNDGAMTRLQFCSELLTSTYIEEKIAQEDLENITGMIEGLFESIMESSLDSALRLTLLEEVERLRAALSMYRIKGAKGLKQSLQSTIGMVVANQGELTSVADANADVLERLGKLIDKIDTFTSKALKVHKALTKPVQFLISAISDDTEPSDISADEAAAEELL